ncbi:CLUMA_CG021273, isoform A [Clunio marinus]|uniref:CLUMA_CG021273, isoform A n=1 Tax=Clunio marinus TaxID=568069 RepID=A0A1J1JA85_9DIPT|nr:CLUMA_CG021273, isoform A [Clunio marinus]
MDVKCIFIIVFTLVLINHQEVDSRLNPNAICLCETFDDINNAELFEFVVRNPHMVNKGNFQRILTSQSLKKAHPLHWRRNRISYSHPRFQLLFMRSASHQQCKFNIISM